MEPADALDGPTPEGADAPEGTPLADDVSEGGAPAESDGAPADAAVPEGDAVPEGGGAPEGDAQADSAEEPAALDVQADADALNDAVAADSSAEPDDPAADPTSDDIPEGTEVPEGGAAPQEEDDTDRILAELGFPVAGKAAAQTAGDVPLTDEPPRSLKERKKEVARRRRRRRRQKGNWLPEILAVLFAFLLIFGGAQFITDRFASLLGNELQLDQTLLDMYVNDEADLRAFYTKGSKDAPEVIFTSSDEAVAAVTETGHVTAVGSGTAIITCQPESGEAVNCRVNVRSPEDKPQEAAAQPPQDPAAAQAGSASSEETAYASENGAQEDPVETVPKVIYFTFDDGPGGDVTTELLDLLAEYNAKATFFLIGSNAAKYPELVKREFDEGHAVAIHTYSHNYTDIYESKKAFFKDFDKCEELIKSITGGQPRFCRMPGGSNNSYCTPKRARSIIKSLKKRGYRIFDWNALTGDADGGTHTVKEMVKAARTYIKDRKYPVVLIHDSADKTKTVKVMKRLLAYYAKRGYVFKSLEEYDGPEVLFMN